MNLLLKYCQYALIFICLKSCLVYCGIVTINHAPPSLRFGHADALYASELDDMLAASLGFTPNKLTWSGLTVASAFHYPKGIVAFEVKGNGANIKLEGSSFEIMEDVSLLDSYKSLFALVSARAQQQINFRNENASDLIKILTEPVSLPDADVLNEKYVIDYNFLQQMAFLQNFGDYVKEVSYMPDGGKDVLFIEVDSFLPLIKKYGKTSPQVKEADSLLRNSLEQAIDQLKKFYNNRVLVATIIINEKTLSRRIRQTPVESFGFGEIKEHPLNLAPVYSDDFPIVFNIILFLSILLVLIILSVSIAIAFMDPGRDSIIYRMTNPRMKKDQ